MKSTERGEMKEKRLVKGVNKRWSLMGEIFLVCVGFDIELMRHKEASRLQTQPHACVCVIVCVCVAGLCNPPASSKLCLKVPTEEAE